MAINIDGASVQGITIDGAAVQEVTIDGSIVWSAGLSASVTSAISGDTVTVLFFEDTNSDGVADNIETYTLTGGSESFTLSTFDGSAGNDVWWGIGATGGVTDSSYISDVSIGSITWTSQADFSANQEAAGTTWDGLGTHGVGDLHHGYEYGSLIRGLVAYYAFDEEDDATVAYDSALDNHGVINGATRVSGGSEKVGEGAMDFDGSSDYISLTDDPLDFTSAPFSFSAWVKPNTISGGDAVLGNYDGNGYILRLASNSGDIELYLESGVGSSTGTIPADTWSHIVGMNDGSQTKYYINGSLDSVVSDSGVSATSNTTKIGERGDGNNYFDGLIDEVRVYDRALSATEISALYNLTSPSGQTPRSADVPSASDYAAVSRYEFEGDVTDSWGSNDGTDNTSAGFVSGRHGQAKGFDGSDDYITVSDSSSLDITGELSIGGWVKLGVVNQNQVFSTKKYAYRIQFYNGTGTYRAFIGDGTSWGNAFDSSFKPTYGPWNHVMMVYNDSAGEITWYINGQPDATTSYSTSLGTNANDLYLGRRAGGAYLWGDMDDIRIYDRALSPIEIENMYYRDIRRIPRTEVLL